MTSTLNLRITNPSQLIHSIPYLLGFAPTDSLVLVGLDNNRLIVTARVDLDDALNVTGDTIEAMKRGGSSTIIAAVYGVLPGGADLPHGDVTAKVADTCRTLGLDMQDALYVHGGRLWSFLCASQTCCPPEGKPIDEQDDNAAAYATAAAPLPSRTAVEASVAPADQLVPTSLIDHWRQSLDHPSDVVDAIELAATTTRPYSDDELARFGVAMQDIFIRDSVWMGVDSGLDGEALWSEMARRLPAPLNVAPLFVLAWRAWRMGNGALAGIAASRALEVDPDYTAATLLEATLARGISPLKTPLLVDGLPEATA